MEHNISFKSFNLTIPFPKTTFNRVFFTLIYKPDNKITIKEANIFNGSSLMVTQI